MAADGTVGIGEAARMCGVSDETIRRRLRAKRLQNATRDPGAAGAWRIPLTDLVETGLLPFRTTDDLDVGLEGLRIQLAEARTAAAERLARIEDLKAELVVVHRLMTEVVNRHG